MNRYIATNRDTGEAVEYEAATPQAEHLGADWVLESVSVAQGTASEPDTRVYGGRRRLTKLEFIALFGDAAYVAILAMARESVQIEAWVRMLELATPNLDGTSVDLDEARTIDGMQAIGAVLAAQGVVGETWAAGVLNG